MGIAGLLLFIHIVLWLWKFFVWGQRAKGAAMTHAHGLVGGYFMLIFYMYIYLTKTSLDVFNCNTPQGLAVTPRTLVYCHTKRMV